MEQEANTVKSVGTILREARLAKGLTIAAVEAATNIRGTYLTYIENDEYDKTPGEFFVKGAIRNYGNFLGLDGVKLVDTYKASSGGKALHEVEAKGIREAHNVTMKLQLKEKRDVGSGTGKIELPKLDSLPIKQIGMGIVALALIGGLYFAVPKAINWGKEWNASRAQTVATATAEKNTVQEAEKPKAPVYDKVVMELNASDKCWLEVTADGKPIAELMLRAGDKKTYEAKEKLVVKFGSIGAVNITVNGQTINTQGEHGVAIKQYTLENLNKGNLVEAEK